MTDPILDRHDRGARETDPASRDAMEQRRSLEVRVQRLFGIVRLMFESWLAAAKRDPRIIDLADIERMMHIAMELAREDLAAQDERCRNQPGS